MLSILIPFKQDFGEIEPVVRNLLTTATGDLEIIVYNDGSFYGDNKPRALELDFPHTRVINAPQSFGVGFAFDRLVEACQSENIILMGDDVTPHEGWYPKVIQAINSKPESIGCSVCVGNLKPFRRHYGADLLFTVGNDDLPVGSKLRERVGGYTSLFHGRWRPKQSDERDDLPCLMGAFYFTTKSYYKRLGGWDTVAGDRNKGFRSWGCLEPYISLKSWLVGGGCYLDPNIEATHVFSRIDKDRRYAKGSRSDEKTWWNRLLVLETQIMSDYTRNRLYDFVHPELNFSRAKQMIKRNYNYILELREHNRAKFKNDLSVFADKFGYKIN